MAKILAVGSATIDMIFYVDGYPNENQELRASCFCRQRGGNATNTLIVLSQFHHHCSWAGTWVDHPDSQVIVDQLSQFNVDISHSRCYQQGVPPISTVLINTNTGSRTIAHYRDMPELMFEDVVNINPSQFDWIHFEGRNIEQVDKMLRHVRANAPDCPVSLEIEKQRDDIDTLFPLADVLLFSQTYAEAQGLTPQQLLQQTRTQAPLADCVCTLGHQGAIGLTKQGEMVSASAYLPEQVIDTLAAGDTFNAGIIDAYLQYQSLDKALNHACRLAGRKCGQTGLQNLNQDEKNEREQ